MPFAFMTLVACTASGDAVEGKQVFPIDTDSGSKSSSDSKSSSSVKAPDIDPTVFGMFDWVKIPKSTITRGVNSFGVNSFSIATTEVTQKVYEFVMGGLPKQSKAGDERAVSDAFDAFLQIHPADAVHLFLLKSELRFFKIKPDKKNSRILSVVIWFAEEYIIPDDVPVSATYEF